MERLYKGNGALSLAQLVAIAAASGLAFPGLPQTSTVHRNRHREQHESETRAAQHRAAAEVKAWNESVERSKAGKRAAKLGRRLGAA